MSTIGSTPPGLTAPGFETGGQVAFEEARQQGLLRGGIDVGSAEATPAPLLDPGERVLNLSAWQGVDGARHLPRTEGFSQQLAQRDRAEAAAAGVDGILAAF